MPSYEDLLSALRSVMDPEIGKNIVDLGMVRDLEMTPQGTARFTLALTTTVCPLKDQMRTNAAAALRALPGVSAVEISFGEMTAEERQAVLGQAKRAFPQLSAMNRVECLAAVMSGKGGVGKSSLTALIACTLARRGKKVGILDADVTGPSIPRLFGLPPGGLRGSSMGILPAIGPLGIRVVSANLLVEEEDTAVIWRGPMISGAIRQFWEQVLWGKLDYLLVDMPPGTADAAITVIKTLPLNGVVMVTSPQQLAGMVVRKAVRMLQDQKVPILGVVENMSYYPCPESGVRHEIFGPSRVEEIAAAAQTEKMLRLPIDPQIAARCDAGQAADVRLPELETLVDTFFPSAA